MQQCPSVAVTGHVLAGGCASSTEPPQHAEHPAAPRAPPGGSSSAGGRAAAMGAVAAENPRRPGLKHLHRVTGFSASRCRSPGKEDAFLLSTAFFFF